MITLSLREIASIVGGEVIDGDPETLVTGAVEFDSRKIAAGDLFVALGGARVDGHDFAATAIEQGAAGVLEFRPTGAPGIVVPAIPEQDRDRGSYATENDEDGSVAAVLNALGLLARGVLDRIEANGDLTIIGVTGSAGKTSAKDFMATIFSQQGPTVAPPGSFNNEIGHPYTALRCTEETKYLVAEMSARGVGHIAKLASIAPPRIGVVLNVGSAHLGEFGSQDTIALAKGELVESLPPAAAGGVAILNADDELVAGMAPRTDARVVYFSAAGNTEVPAARNVVPDCEELPAAPSVAVYATDVVLDDNARPSFDLHVGEEEPVRITLGVYGEHNVSNALAAIAAAWSAGIPLDTIVAAVQDHKAASAHRMAVRECNGITIIDDAYNANPESMAAGLKTLVATQASADSTAAHETWAVLGPMGELGEDAVVAHSELGNVVAELGIDHLIVVGEQESSAALRASASEKGVCVEQANTNDDAVLLLEEKVQPGDAVLVKASNAYRLWEVADGLVEKSE